MAYKKKKRGKPVFRNIGDLIKFTRKEIEASKANQPKIIPSTPKTTMKKPGQKRKVNPKTGKPEPREPKKLTFNPITKRYEAPKKTVKFDKKGRPLYYNKEINRWELKEPKKLRLVEGLGWVNESGVVVKLWKKEPQKRSERKG